MNEPRKSTPVATAATAPPSAILIPIVKLSAGLRRLLESMPEREDLKGVEEKKPDLIDQPQRPRREVPENRRGAPGWIY